MINFPRVLTLATQFDPDSSPTDEFHTQNKHKVQHVVANSAHCMLFGFLIAQGPNFIEIARPHENIVLFIKQQNRVDNMLSELQKFFAKCNKQVVASPELTCNPNDYLIKTI